MFSCDVSQVGAGICDIIKNFIYYIVDPILLVLAVVAGLIFVVGIVEFLIKTSNGENNNNGKQHMLWGLVGLFIIVSTGTILIVISNTVKIFLP